MDFLCIPQYIEKVRSIEYGINIGIKYLHVMAGNTQKSILPKTLRYACKIANYKMDILIEPLNSKDHPNYFLSSIDQAIEILLEVDLPNLKIMFDFYHIHHMKGEVLFPFSTSKETY